MQRGAQRGGPARISQAGEGLGLCRQGEAGQGVEATEREAAWQGRGERQVADGDQVVAGVEEPLAAGGAWQPADLLEGGEDFTRGNNHKGIELLALGGGPIVGKQAPEAFVRAVAHTGDIALQHADAWQKHLLGAQPAHRPLEEQAGALASEPGAGEAPAGEAPAALGMGVVDVAVALANVEGVEPAHARALVAREVVGRGDGELLGKRADQSGWDVGGGVAKGAEAANGGELHGVAEAGMIAAKRGEHGAVGGVEEGVAGEEVGGQRLGKRGLARLLGRREEVDRHAASEAGTVAVRTILLTVNATRALHWEAVRSFPELAARAGLSQE